MGFTTMIIHLTALILLRTLSLVQTSGNRHLISMREVHVGENVTLKCQISKTTKSSYWLKQAHGYTVQTMAALLGDTWTLYEPFNDSRFQIKKEDDYVLLTIKNVTKEDEATYFCQDATTFSSEFTNGTLLAIKDCCSEKTVKVEQSPESAAVQPGDSVSLQCSLSCQSKETNIQCPDENSVYWFRASSEGADSGVIDNPKNRSVKKEERSCVYSLSKTIQSSSDAGTYYCAVFTCGEILFGKGTSVETGLPPNSGSEPSLLVVMLGVSLACCVVVIAVLIFFIKQKRVCGDLKGQMTTSQAGCEPSRNMGELRAMTYAALDFPGRKPKRGANKQRDTPQECEYSAVRTRPAPSDPNSGWSASAS